MTENLTRALEMTVRAASTDSREFDGIAVPWDDVITVWGQKEKFARGAIVDSDGAKIFWQHGEIIGRLMSHRDVDAGWDITGTISATTRGDEAMTLLRDGTIDRLSIGFQPIESHQDGDVTVYTKVQVREISLVPFPAYANAKISNVRHDTPPQKEIPPMTETLTRDDLDTALTASAGEQTRAMEVAIAALRDGTPAPAPQFRSMGEFVKRLAGGDSDAQDLYQRLNANTVEGDTFRRAYTGGTSADSIVGNTFITDQLRIVEKRRTITNLFQTAPLPPEGMTLEYAKVLADTTAVAEQLLQGDDLVTGKVTIDTATTPVKTYGGHTSMSRQEIERSSVAILSTTFTALAMKYAQQTEARVKAVLAAGIAANLLPASTNKVTLKFTPTAFDWIDIIVDAAELADDNGYSLDGALVSKDVFKTLIRLEDRAGNSMMKVTGSGFNQVGTISAPGLSGSLADVQFRLLPGAAAGTAAFYDDLALTTWESAGAPLQLQDENILNLTKSYSVYGYLASAIQFPTALIPVKFATV